MTEVSRAPLTHRRVLKTAFPIVLSNATVPIIGLVDTGVVDFDDVRLDRSVLGVRDAGLGHLRLTNPTDAPARLMLLGGEPFDEGIVMWWNFIGRSHEDIVRMRQEWNDAPDDRFGRVAGYRGPTQRLAAPPLPADLKLKRRFRRGRQ